MIKEIKAFDLDDTLIFSDAKFKIYDTNTNKLIVSLTPSEFNYHIARHDQFMSFEDFHCENIIGNSRINTKYFNLFKRYISKGIPVAIVTARENRQLILDFLKTKNIVIDPNLVYTVHAPSLNYTGTTPERKKQAIEDLVSKGYNDITFYDDSIDNLNAAFELNSDTVKIKIKHVINAKKET